ARRPREPPLPPGRHVTIDGQRARPYHDHKATPPRIPSRPWPNEARRDPSRYGTDSKIIAVAPGPGRRIIKERGHPRRRSAQTIRPSTAGAARGDRPGGEVAEGGPGSNVWVVLGCGHSGRGGCRGAPGAPFGGEGVQLPPGQERREGRRGPC